jgi:hypothetical protein
MVALGNGRVGVGVHEDVHLGHHRRLRASPSQSTVTKACNSGAFVAPKSQTSSVGPELEAAPPTVVPRTASKQGAIGAPGDADACRTYPQSAILLLPSLLPALAGCVSFFADRSCLPNAVSLLLLHSPTPILPGGGVPVGIEEPEGGEKGMEGWLIW